jgi:hypothetical protein
MDSSLKELNTFVFENCVIVEKQAGALGYKVSFL